MIERQTLTKSQEELFVSIIEAAAEGTRRFVIRGISGCGKSFLTTKLLDRLPIITEPSLRSCLRLHWQGDYFSREVDYFPFHHGAPESGGIGQHKVVVFEKVAGSMAADIPVGRNTVQVIVDLLFDSFRRKKCFTHILSKGELDLVFRLQYACEKKSPILYVDNLHWWDTASLRLLHVLINNTRELAPFLENCIILANLTTDQECLHSEKVERFLSANHFVNHKMHKIELDEYVQMLDITFGMASADPKMKKLLYVLSNGHLQFTKSLAEGYSRVGNADGTLFGVPLQDEFDKVRVILDGRMASLGESRIKVDEFLRFASTHGLNFALTELAKSVRREDHECQEIAGVAENMHFIELFEKRGRFSHEVVRDAFLAKVKENKAFYHQRVAETLKGNLLKYRFEAAGSIFREIAAPMTE